MIVFATPMYGGMCCTEFFNSALELRGTLVASGVGHQWLTTTNESLVTRARNLQVARFMNDPELKDYTHFMFIDADIQFKPDDVAKLYNLDVDVATAAYPMKRPGSDVTAWKDGKLVELEKLNEPTPIDYAGTGFLLIKRQVFERMYERFPELEHDEGSFFERDKTTKVYALFDTEVTDDGNGKFYCSEDYLFCRRWRSMGGEIILEPSIRLGHVGRKIYT